MKRTKKQGTQDEKAELSPRMRRLILGFDATGPMDAKPATDKKRRAKGRAASKRAA